MVMPDMATPPTTPTNREAELEKKLAEIGSHEQSLVSRQLAEELGLPFADLRGLPIDPEALRRIPEENAREAGTALVQASGGVVVVVTLDPRTPAAKSLIDKLRAQYPELRVVLVAPDTMGAVWERYRTIKTTKTFEVGAIQVDDSVITGLQGALKNLSDIQSEIGRSSTTHLLEVLIAGALATHASDIHVEPEQDKVRIRYRLDGLLHDAASLDAGQAKRAINRLKVLSKLKLNVTKAPQDGRFTIHQDAVDIEVRVSIIPGEYGESVVLRLLDPRTIRANLEDLGMRADVLEQVKRLLTKPQGMFLTTGPTGSGKTTTLYAFVNKLNTPDTKIITIEDPIEYHITGISQTQSNPEKGYTFSSGLRSIVRQDPDIILVGEIRDLETSGIALNAALTGHLVLSTVHTNDAAGTVPRLIDIGSKAETIASALTMAMGQRLLRRLCPDCKKPTPPEASEVARIATELAPIRGRFGFSETIDPGSFLGPVGCSACNGTGYQGRIGVYEVFEVSPQMERLILKNPAVSDIRDLAIKEGMVTMLQDSYLKLLEGVTSLEEVRRILG